MSLYNRKIGNAVYRVFKKDGTNQIHLGPVGKEDPEKVKEALAYIQQSREQSMKHWDELELQLLGHLPKKTADGYVSLAVLVKEKPRRILQSLERKTPRSASDICKATGIALYDVNRNFQPLREAGLAEALGKAEVSVLRDQMASSSRAYYVLTQKGEKVRNHISPAILELLNIIETSPKDVYKDGFRIRWKIINELDNHPEGMTTKDLMSSLYPYIRKPSALSYHLSSLRDILRAEVVGAVGRNLRYHLNLPQKHLATYRTLKALLEF